MTYRIVEDNEGRMIFPTYRLEKVEKLNDILQISSIMAYSWSKEGLENILKALEEFDEKLNRLPLPCEYVSRNINHCKWQECSKVECPKHLGRE